MKESIKQIQFVKKRIAQLRMDRGMSERQLSKLLLKSPNYIGTVLDLKNPNGAPSLNMFFEICAVLEISPKEFFEDGHALQNQTDGIIQEILRLTRGEKDKLDDLLYFLKKMEPEWFLKTLELMKT